MLVDVPDQPHGEAMARIARAACTGVRIRWCPPSLRLADDLRAVAAGDPIAIPFGIIGGNENDIFTRAVMAAIGDVRAAGTPVFVSAGNETQNALAAAGVSCTPFEFRTGVRIGAVSGGSSGSAVLAAVLSAVLRARQVRLVHWPPLGRLPPAST